MPIMTADIESKIHKIISDQLHELGCPLRIINGMPDHIHCLFLLNSQKSIAEVMKQIKGSSSHTINLSDLLKQKFSWQTGYAAFSVSESVAERVYHYIKNQKAHHQKKTFQNEYNNFVKVNGLQNV